MDDIISLYCICTVPEGDGGCDVYVGLRAALWMTTYPSICTVPEGDRGCDVYAGLRAALVDDNISLYTVPEGDGGCDVYVGLGTALVDDDIALSPRCQQLPLPVILEASFD